MGATKRLLIVDDDQELCMMLVDYFVMEGFEVEAVHEGEAGLSRIRSGRHDLVILDMMLPRLNGLDVLRRTRLETETPIVFLTARGGPSDRIVGLELGADDYLVKPFDARELLARVNAVLRRGARLQISSEFSAGRLRLSPGNRKAFSGEVALTLTSVEFDLLLALVRKQGQVLSREVLAREIGRQLLPFDRTIDMHILNLRKKLMEAADDQSSILTIRGSGYMLAVDEDRS